MMEKFKALLKDKAKKGMYLDENKKKAKMDILDEIDGIMEDSIGKKLKGLKKVTVASDSEEGLKKGLEMAKDKMDAEDEMCSECEGKGCEACEMEEASEEDSEEDEDMADSDKIAMYEKMIKELKSKK